MKNIAAQQLWNARLNGRMLPADFAGMPLTENDAYRIQAEQMALTDSRIIGWKIGATSKALFPVLGLKKPFVGPLFAEFRFDSGATVPIRNGDSLETEITLRLKHGLKARDKDYSREEVTAAVASIQPSFEIVGARFEGGFGGAGCKIIADGGANVAAVFGAGISNWQANGLRDLPVDLSINGAVTKTGSTAALIWDHPFDAISWMLKQPALSQRGLLSGDLIMTGTCTGITPLADVEQAQADFGEFGAVSARFHAGAN